MMSTAIDANEKTLAAYSNLGSLYHFLGHHIMAIELLERYFDQLTSHEESC
jgi:hypothetical protein